MKPRKEVIEFHPQEQIYLMLDKIGAELSKTDYEHDGMTCSVVRILDEWRDGLRKIASGVLEFEDPAMERELEKIEAIVHRWMLEMIAQALTGQKCSVIPTRHKGDTP